MYGQESQTKLNPTCKQVHAIFPRYAYVTKMGKPERFSRQSACGVAFPSSYERRKEGAVANRSQQRRLISRPSYDAKVWRAKQKRCNKGCSGVDRSRVYSSNVPAERRQSAKPLCAYLLSNIDDQGQGIHPFNTVGIKGLSKRLAVDFYIPILGLLCPYKWESWSISEQWCPCLWGSNACFDAFYIPKSGILFKVSKGTCALGVTAGEEA